MAEKTVTGGRPKGVWRWQPLLHFTPLPACVPLLWSVSWGGVPSAEAGLV